MPFDLAVIDLDNTLYAADTGVFARMDRRMTAFVAKALGVNEVEANRLRLKYWKDYGTTLRGLMLHHSMEPEAFLHDVHDVGAHEILSYDAELDAALARLPCRKVIHTNGIREHAERVLNALGIAHHFERIYDIRFDNYIPKPCSKVLQKLLAAEGVEPSRTLVVDDMVDNLKAAHELGCKTIWITHNPDGRWDFHLPSVHHLPTRFGY
ncbi:MAG: pyrimidine 5'-nucleotidase [Zetaproteobacteria bacterium CG06_land_8_20_14_3_00_59_53]|nr:MAG: pyrimidine 5'-nucleotidase [Zetaproteobacteria bacterium CG2_30_59_37]PIO90890.1 MAG: pyrimidine 5'-nucleotidase [Zetaproteobacteria bacterium CG23_combo_of_CG06-09_8_20_14_all_59_86]PIQ64140.1 MAG: pyrimidine 5'-nucleotidase [Zetaproteobacteria bacterium CG11_big_fil_rev_8_21_14_0_20_59_439]PIU71071.1 MAG: pyrimidine 5'-nucleotidase [Zetaproteobacteria bacterium CG06_land_8_20_14_3_00_59_53]PIU96065.1 MAG: pyrimidine 5'-nucleotidase [Zetaproteobacteria bacterium CG03_land_8_20_14_0_80_